MNTSEWLFISVIFAAFALIFGGTIVAVIGAAAWLNRSTSPRAARLRHLLGGRERLPATGEKGFYRPGEDRALCRAAAKAFAASRGLPYVASDAGLLTPLRRFRDISSRSADTVEDVVRWEGFALLSYTTEDTERSTTKTLLYGDASALQLPAFFITGETIVHKTLFANCDVDFDEDPGFSSRFYLEGPDQAAIRALFGSDVRAAFVAVGECRLECIGSHLLFSESQKTTVAAFELFVEESTRLFEALKERWSRERRFRR